MENPILGQCPEGTVTYDYRMYDRIWQRVSPELNPYPEIRAAAAEAQAAAAAAADTSTSAPASTPAAVSTSAPTPAAVSTSAPTPTPEPTPAAVSASAPATPAPASVPAGTAGTAEAQLPGAETNPCCMGSQARESLAVLEGFIEEELAERRYCLTLCRRVRSAQAARLLRRIAAEKQCAARDMCTAYFLITGQCYTPAIAVEQMQWDNLAAALRSCYHQEACNGFNYARAADGTADQCLQRLFTKLSKQSYQRADEVMCVLGQVL